MKTLEQPKCRSDLLPADVVHDLGFVDAGLHLAAAVAGNWNKKKIYGKWKQTNNPHPPKKNKKWDFE